MKWKAGLFCAFAALTCFIVGSVFQIGELLFFGIAAAMTGAGFLSEALWEGDKWNDSDEPFVPRMASYEWLIVLACVLILCGQVFFTVKFGEQLFGMEKQWNYSPWLAGLGLFLGGFFFLIGDAFAVMVVAMLVIGATRIVNEDEETEDLVGCATVVVGLVFLTCFSYMMFWLGAETIKRGFASTL